MLQKRSTRDDPNFKMAFNFPEEVHGPHTGAREVIISIKIDTPKESKTFQMSPIPSPGATPAPENYVWKLRTKFTQSTPELNVVSRTALQTSLSDSSSPPLEISLNDLTSNAGPNQCTPVNLNSISTPPSLTDSISRLGSI